MPKVECLILRNVGLKKLGDFKVVPKLKYCDFGKNLISDLKAVTKLFARATWIEVANLLENPVCHKTNFREKLIATNVTLSLRFLNSKEVDVEERVKVNLN